jgi:hypothetical protein
MQLHQNAELGHGEPKRLGKMEALMQRMMHGNVHKLTDCLDKFRV